ncbi:leucyl-tRNA synthetase, putative [Theileria equi strain WA]|uniref:leucine--tRNA ligase n=1 Tax=Theileria equi strain WA TaxID=1537102 RepID=L0B0H4_THEEQ|nr:leucyl-tRNA synthetase, putative [Theileria equi strain WA]AFZ81315.1 leucyl-tRNA synthetase, putative [Theileria equi strain WA]|eukprot:XP_004830981.1 leucyl-tRNA synthetase, putative [Theileria equi strain WA]
MSKRAQLLENEAAIRSLWQDTQVYESNVPSSHSREKYFCTFPFPYMNGRLHIGHAFSALKSEFQARFQRTQGKAVLWPFGLHCTGMPIMACADKIKLELQEAHNDQRDNPVTLNVDEDNQKEHDIDSKDFTKFTSAKSKLSAKSNKQMTQMEIMKHMGISDEEIPKFANPDHWLTYFSPLAIQDMKMLGVSVDWRRSFITTNRNPYYNAFVEWQFNRLKKLNALLYGSRPSILSRLVMQPCADHDRSEGEGAVSQEYTVIKMKLSSLEHSPANFLWKDYASYKDILSTKSVYLLAATLRPETLYGQTNLFVVPVGEYGAYLGYNNPSLEFNSFGVVENMATIEEAVKSCDCIYITSERSAYNMAHQGITLLNSESGTLENLHCIAKYNGKDLIGASVIAPLSIYGTVYVVPMVTASMLKGTGIVACVPSDSPDDYITIFEMRKKKEYFKDNYNVNAEYCALDPVPIIDIPEIGTCGAMKLCEEEKIVSSKESQKLEKCKEILYKKGFYNGIMNIGPHKGSKVSDVKDKIRSEMIKQSDAFIYYEPTKRVVSRSGDVCVVGICNQWYTKFGDADWKGSVTSHVADPSKFTCYSESTLNQVKHVVQWLDNWACSRSYGLGTVLPWEDIKKNKNSLIESLSDSTIYMAYYTISHYLQGDIFGSSCGSLGIDAKELNDDVFDYIFRITDSLPCEYSCNNDFLSKLELMRNDFSYWYPVDLRSSGKDLIFNHLTMSLFIHDAVWKDVKDFEAMPKSYYCNGHILVDSEKMSKSKGNFLTLEDAIKTYTSDGTRIALADAGDSLDDANFSKETAEAAVLKLHSVLLAAQSDISQVGSNSSDISDMAKFAGEIFENEIKVLADKAKFAYENFIYRDALKACFYDFITLRQNYIQLSRNEFDYKLLKFYHEIFCKIASPIIPHICEYIWVYLLKNETKLSNELWPTFTSGIDWNLHRKIKLLYKNLEEFRKCKEKSQALDKKHSRSRKYTGAVIYVAREYPVLNQEVLKLLQRMGVGEKDIPEKEMIKEMCTSELVKNASVKDKKTILAFASFQGKEAATVGSSALLLQLPYSELDLYKLISPYIVQTLDVSGKVTTNNSILYRCTHNG